MTKPASTNRLSNKSLQVIFGLLATGFGCLIIGIIFIANRGELDSYFGFLSWVPNGDKVGHFFLMGILALLVNLSLKAKQIQIGGWKFLLGSMIITILVTGEELSQAFLPNRTLSILDWVADMAGIILFGQLAKWIVSKWVTQSGVTERT